MTLPARLPSHTTKTLTRDLDVDLALHSWLPETPRGVVAYVHGLQSHAGWSWELALDFTERELGFLCLDRRGSGLSSGPRDHFAHHGQVIEDYAAFLRHAQQVADGNPVVAVGHCLGGSILTATLASHPELVDGLAGVVLVSAWVSRLHRLLSPRQLAQLRVSSDEAAWDVGLLATDFTADREYQEFIERDPLAVRHLRQSTRKHILGLEEEYQRWRSPASLRTSYVSAFRDPIIDVADAIDAAREIYGPTMSAHLLGSDRHYLPFTPARSALVAHIAQTAA